MRSGKMPLPLADKETDPAIRDLTAGSCRHSLRYAAAADQNRVAGSPSGYSEGYPPLCGLNQTSKFLFPDHAVKREKPALPYDHQDPGYRVTGPEFFVSQKRGNIVFRHRAGDLQDAALPAGKGGNGHPASLQYEHLLHCIHDMTDGRTDYDARHPQRA